MQFQITPLFLLYLGFMGLLGYCLGLRERLNAQEAKILELENLIFSSGTFYRIPLGRKNSKG